MKSLIFLGLVLATATIATTTIATTTQVAHADLSKCVPLIATELNDTAYTNSIGSSTVLHDMANIWQCIHANNQTK